MPETAVCLPSSAGRGCGSNPRNRRAGVLVSLVALAICAGVCVAGPAQAQAPAVVSIQPSLTPAKLGASATFTLALQFGAGSRVAPPLSGMVVRLPAGLRLELGGVPSCSVSSLSRHGAASCPTGSLLGRGRALLKVHAGSQTLPEQASVDERGDPAFAIVGHGETPLDESTLSRAVLEPDSAPYGSKLIVSVPPIPTLVYEPDASFSSLSLTIGGAGRRRGSAGTVSVPQSCSRGGFPFAASFTFADRSTASTSTRLPCP
jgi:hypothetical protein